MAISGLELASLATSRLFMLLFARCLGMTWFAPVLSGVDFSRIVRIIGAGLFALLVFPAVSANVGSDSVLPTFNNWGAATSLLWALVFEFFIGATVGFSLKLFFQGVFLAGEAIARVGGVSVAESFDPSLGGESSAPSSFLFWLAIAVFTACGGLEAFTDGFLSFLVSAPPSLVFDSREIVERLVTTLSGSFALGLRIAAPTILTTGAVYLGVGVNSRLFSQLNLSIISFNFNGLLTLVLIFLCIGVFCQVFQFEIVNLIEKLFVRSV